MSLSRSSYRNEYGVAGMMKLAQEAKPPEIEKEEPKEKVKARKVDGKKRGDESKKNAKNRDAMIDKLSVEERATRNKNLARSKGLNKALEQQSALMEEALEGLDADANRK